MNTTQPAKKQFSIAMANSMLPLVRSITADIVQLTREFEQTQERLDYLNESRVAERSDDVYGKEVSSIEKHNDQKSDNIKLCISELADLGLGTHDVAHGYVDFPAQRKNKPVCLCWKLGEAEVKYWHALGENCSARRPVDLDLIRQSGNHQLSESL